MMFIDELCPDDFWDIVETLVVQYAINIVLVVFDQLFCRKLRSVFVLVLQLLRLQPHATNNIEPFLGQFFL